MSALTRSALSESFNTNLPDNNSGLITPAVLRTELINTIDSVVFNNGDTQTISGSQSISGSLIVQGDTLLTGSLTVSGSNTFNNIGLFTQRGQLTINDADSTTGFGLLPVALVSGAFYASSSLLGHQIIGNVSASGNVSVNGKFEQTGSAHFKGEVLKDAVEIIASSIGGALRIVGDITQSASSGKPLFTSSGIVRAETGSFARLEGHSPITVGSEVTFEQPVNLASSNLTISGSLTVSGSNTFNNVGRFTQRGQLTINDADSTTGFGVLPVALVSGAFYASSSNLGHQFIGNISASGNVTISGSLLVTGSTHTIDGTLNVTSDRINFLNLPTIDTGVPGRLFRSGSFVKVSV